MSALPGDAVHDAVSLARLALADDDARRLIADCRRVAEAWRGLPGNNDGDDDGATPEPGAAPAHPVGLHDVLRDDEPAPGLSSDEALAGAPAVEGNAFVVPRVADVS